MTAVFNSTGVQDRKMMRVVYDFPMDMVCQVMAFNAKVKEVVKDIKAVQILVRCTPEAKPIDPTD